MRGSKPLVSIIIPCWNAERYLAEAVESALGQTYAAKEVIVIDDGSTDGSGDVIRSYGDRIRPVQTANRGASAARNSGIRLARGAVVQFLDADDLMCERKLAVQVARMSEDPNEIVYCDRKSYRFGFESKAWIDAPSEDGDAVIFALNKIVSVASPIYSRKLLLAHGGFREHLPCAQDYDLNLRLALAGCRFRRHPEVLLTVRRRDQSVSSDSMRVVRQMMVLWRELLAELHRCQALTEARRAAIAARFSGVGRVYIRLGQRAEAQACFDEAISIHPEGGDLGYSPGTRILRRIVGRRSTEFLVEWKRRLMNESNRPR